MTKKDIMEIKRRLKIDKTTINRIAGCYVDEKKNKVTTFTQDFLDLDEEEVHKYLDIAGKVLSGTPKNNLLELAFPTDEELSGGVHQSLIALNSSQLKSEGMLDSFFDHIIETYDTVDHYIILLFFDIYDIPMKTSDGMGLDESEEVYEYLMGAICPVRLSKPGLGYHEDENRIAPRIRDWVVGPVESGFTFPCFSDRSSDIHHVLVYTKNAKEPHTEFWEDGLGAISDFTSTQKRNGFLGLVAKAVGEENEETPDVLLDVQQNIHDFVEQEEKLHESDEPIVMTKKDMTEILEDSGIPENRAERIASSYDEMFPEDSTAAEELYENRALKNNEIRAEKKVLQGKVVELNEELKKVGLVNDEGEIMDIVIRTRPGRDNDISTSFVDGRRCIVIPLHPDDTATVNGKEL